jgi:hypothetical protein
MSVLEPVTVESWHRWYLDHDAAIANVMDPNHEDGRLVHGIVRDFLHLARPAAWRIDGSAGGDIRSTTGYRYRLDPTVDELADGAEWRLVVDDRSGRLAREGEPIGPVWRIDTIETWGTDPRGAISLHGARQFGPTRSRSGPRGDGGPAIEALTVLGLMETLGLSHGRALRAVVAWPEVESNAPAGADLWHDYERTRAKEHRRLWAALAVRRDGQKLVTVVVTA